MHIFGNKAAGTRFERLFTICRPENDRVEASRPVRRVAGIAVLAGYPTFIVLGDADVGGLAGNAALFATLCVYLWGVYVVYEFRRRLASAADSQLDERERKIRDRAHLVGHRLTVMLTFLSGFIAAIALAATNTQATFDGNMAFNIGITVAIVSLLMPSVVVAWTEPDDPVEADPLLADHTDAGHF